MCCSLKKKRTLGIAYWCCTLHLNIKLTNLHVNDNCYSFVLFALYSWAFSNVQPLYWIIKEERKLTHLKLELHWFTLLLSVNSFNIGIPGWSQWEVLLYWTGGVRYLWKEAYLVVNIYFIFDFLLNWKRFLQHQVCQS